MTRSVLLRQLFAIRAQIDAALEDLATGDETPASASVASQAVCTHPTSARHPLGGFGAHERWICRQCEHVHHA